MSWVFAGGLAIAAFLIIVFVLKASRKGWEVIAAALVLGVAGYGLQASPGLGGSPKAPAQDAAGESAALVEARQAIAGDRVPPGNKWVVIGDALARHGQFAEAVKVYQGAVEKDPGNGEAWLAMANALVAHADGSLTPAALLAFRRAGEAAPDHPGPPFFFGLALAQSGRLEEARATWASLLQNTPPEAPWRADLAERLSRLDAFIKARQSAGEVR